MSRYRASTVLFLALFAGICILAMLHHSAAQKTITLNYSNFFPTPHKHIQLAEQWSREVDKRTENKVKISYFPGGTLTPTAQTYDKVVEGADIGFNCFAYTRGKFPLTEVIDLPLGYKNGISATRLINAYYAKFKPKELDDVKVLYLHAHGPDLLHTKNPSTNLKTWKA
jgi:TRAP-type transport system periplasmic protein